jgi:methylenetetrahydrofolate reductase (NADPH)
MLGLLGSTAQSSVPPQCGASYEVGSLMRNEHISEQVADLLTHSRFEVLPTNTIEQTVVESVPRDVRLTVTTSPTKGLDRTLDLAGRLIGHGYEVVPHLSARLVRDEAHLKDLVQWALEIGVEDVFVPAGDVDPPAGKYVGAIGVLAELTAMGRPFKRVGITGYPESHPLIADDITIQSMWEKREHATYMVSNLCFDPEVLSGWVQRVRARGVMLPIYVGLAGPVARTKLLTMATKIGVGDSAKFLKSHVSWFLRFAAPGGYSPERLLKRSAKKLTGPEALIAGLHMFTFNQVAETERWRRELLQSARRA